MSGSWHLADIANLANLGFAPITHILDNPFFDPERNIDASPVRNASMYWAGLANRALYDRQARGATAAAVLAADIAGYSRLMGRDEERTLAQLKALRVSIRRSPSILVAS
jgi:hypothetical protein